MRLIDADELKKDIAENYVFTGFVELLNDFMEVINNAPTVDPPKELICSVTVDTDEVLERLKELGWEPVEHGRWIDTIEEDERVVWCSRCSDEYNEENINLASWVKTYFKYCPNCGAKMDEEEQDEID